MNGILAHAEFRTVRLSEVSAHNELHSGRAHTFRAAEAMAGAHERRHVRGHPGYRQRGRPRLRQRVRPLTPGDRRNGRERATRVPGGQHRVTERRAGEPRRAARTGG
nr:hypothetical protein Aca09nite_26620 [Actinoplanes campanulatus]